MNKYNHKSRVITRADWWYYGWNASYYVTIVSKNRKNYFGAISNKKMALSEIGQIADACWREIVEHTKNVDLGPYVVMPNHLHGILNLRSNTSDTPPFAGFAGTRHALSLQTELASKIDLPEHNMFPQMRFQNPGKNTLSSIIGGYKSAVSKYAHRAEYGFQWQARFNDHIILNDKEYDRISQYIINNPANWEDDELHSE